MLILILWLFASLPVFCEQASCVDASKHVPDGFVLGNTVFIEGAFSDVDDVATQIARQYGRTEYYIVSQNEGNKVYVVKIAPDAKYFLLSFGQGGSGLCWVWSLRKR